MTKFTCAVPWSVPRLVFSGTRRPNSLWTYITTSSARPMRFISWKKPAMASEQYSSCRSCGDAWFTCVSNRLLRSGT